MDAPFKYRGGKSRVAGEVWRRFSDVRHYIEPFCGSAAVLLARPGGAPEVGYETVNDADGLLVNFWRALKHAPHELLEAADGPRSSIDLAARNNRLHERVRRGSLVEDVMEGPEFFDLEAAVDWWYVVSTIIAPRGAFEERFGLRKPNLWRGGAHTTRITEQTVGELADRLRGVRILCHDWRDAVAEPELYTVGTPCGVFLDPPYTSSEYDGNVYRVDADGNIADEVAEWAIRHGDDDRLKIAYCGWAGDVEFPDTWEAVGWTGHGGHARKTGDDEDRHRETVWFSPGCTAPQETLF